MEDIVNALDGLEVVDTSTKRKVKREGNGLVVTFGGDTSSVLERNEQDRVEASRLNLRPNFDNDGFVHLGRIPRVIVDMWKTEGFDLFSAEASKMTPEEHWRETLRRLSGDWSKFNVSKYKRLV